MNDFLNWIIENEVLLNTILAFLSFIITSVLTFVIIYQTSKLSKQQSKQEMEISKQQAELQKRQIRLDTFDYKNNIYHALHKVFQMTGEIHDMFEKIELDKKPMDKLYLLFDSYREQLRIDVSDTMWLFKQAEYILPSNIYESVYDISKSFNELTGDISKFKLFALILTNEEIETEKKKLLQDIKMRCDQINSHVLFIDTIMPTELFIRNIDR